MKILSITATTILFSISLCSAQSTDIVTDSIAKKKENLSTETVTKTIRIKGANGEEKVITKQEVITKKSKIELNPDDLEKTNQSASYSNEEVVVAKSLSSSEADRYVKVADEKGFTITLLTKTDTIVTKARIVNDNYYLVNFGQKNNCLGYFDKDQNFIVESYNSKTDQIITTIYQKE